MPRILTVDDSRAIRTLVGKQVVELGFEVDEAEDGEQGLARLAELAYDLVILDITMPVLDGPGMLAKMRERGVQTPVLMLTSESKRSIVAGVMKLGIEDYILKPFKPEELRAKVVKALKLGGAAASAGPVAAVPSAGPERLDAGKQFIDLLVVDDMENVPKRLRTMLPNHLTLNACVSAQSALTYCRERVYRVVLVDTDIPDVDSTTLMNQLRALQPHAACVALALRSANDVAKEVQAQGFDEVLFKPFDPDSVEDFLLRFFDNQELVVGQDDLLKVAAFAGKEERVERYFSRVKKLLEESLEKIAAACFDAAVVDISAMPLRPDKLSRLLIGLEEEAAEHGIGLKVVATAEGLALLRGFDETAKLQTWPTVAEARAA